MAKISIIIRTQNEERWIRSCLNKLFAQDIKNYEVIIVDNKSTDCTVEFAKKFPIKKLISLDNYRPGKALNEGIKVSSGEFLVFLSAHCIPKHKKWLYNLIRNFNNPKVAGVYGRQEPLPFSSDSDKRDLLTVFGLDKRIQKKDFYFHNANSAIRREIWEQIPFDETVTNIEDRIWAKQVVKEGWYLVYEPEAEVYHYHGINQSGDPDRCKRVVSIMEKLENANISSDSLKGFLDSNIINIYAFLPVLGKAVSIAGIDLMARCINNLQNSLLVKNIIVITEDKELLKRTKTLGMIGFERSKEFSDRFSKSLVDVFNDCMNHLREKGIIFHDSDLILYANYLFPFRPDKLVFYLLKELLLQGLESVIPASREYQQVWSKENDRYKRLDIGFVPLSKAKTFFRGCAGLGTLTMARYIRNGNLLGDKVGLLIIENPLYALKVNNDYSYQVAEFFLKKETTISRK